LQASVTVDSMLDGRAILSNNVSLDKHIFIYIAFVESNKI
jgi:hypothetical protein